MSDTELADRLALQDVMLNYAAGVDDRNLEQYRNCFADDMVALGFGTQTYEGKEAWIAYVWSALDKYSASQHMLGPQLATIDGDIARTRNDVQALHYFKPTAEDPDDTRRFMLWATYVTDMRREADGWKIIRHELVTRGTDITRVIPQ